MEEGLNYQLELDLGEMFFLESSTILRINDQEVSPLETQKGPLRTQFILPHYYHSLDI